MKIRANIAVRANTHKAAGLAIDNGYDKTIDMADSDEKAEIDPTNVGLAEFGIQTKTSLADSVYKTCCKWAIDDFTKCSNSNLIILFIMNIGAKSATHREKSLIICRCQVDKLDCLDIGNIDYISEDVVSLGQKIIRYGS